ncbi:M42 family peptidase [Rickettsia endosymbiont of Cardiosporidium cionae]|nr:M42 family peptidase [Rickettsia endosymbiont of Cardiosporidium cionae]
MWSDGMKNSSLRMILIYFYLILIACNSAYTDTSLENLKKLCDAYGVSGFEGDVREILSKYRTEHKIQYEIDGMGNLIGKIPTHSKKSLLI